MAATLPSAACQRRTQEFRRNVWPLPGSVPQDNHRPMYVSLAYDRASLRSFLAASHPHIDVDVWSQRARAGLLAIDGRTIGNLDQKVRAGNRLVHTIEQEIEPAVNVNLTFVYEDQALAVVSKPAPMAIHPCGRYNRNSLLYLLAHAFGPEVWHPVHRLDADTAGLVVLAKTPMAARHLAKQFASRAVSKIYLARVRGVPPAAHFNCDWSITDAPGILGKRTAHEKQDTTSRNIKSSEAFTSFEHIDSFGNECLVTAAPHSGRTNQIRVHLAALGLPIVGDHAYAGNDEFTSGQSPLCLHAWQLTFCHPDDDRVVAFEDERPPWAQTPRRSGADS